MHDTTLPHLRTLLAETTRSRGRGCGYPAAVRAEVLAYVRVRQREGLSTYAIAKELGTRDSMLSRWLDKDPTTAPFRAIAVVEAPPSPAHAPVPGLTLHGPGGLRVEGLDVDTLVRLCRKLA